MCKKKGSILGFAPKKKTSIPVSLTSNSNFEKKNWQKSFFLYTVVALYKAMSKKIGLIERAT